MHGTSNFSSVNKNYCKQISEFNFDDATSFILSVLTYLLISSRFMFTVFGYDIEYKNCL